MDKRFLRPLLIAEFLLALQVVFTVWSQVGGQYHLDLMFWPWKLGVSFTAAALIAAITGNLLKNDGTITRRSVVYIAVLIATLIVAGAVTYYYHVNEPTDEDDDNDSPVRISRLVDNGGAAIFARCPFFFEMRGEMRRWRSSSPALLLLQTKAITGGKTACATCSRQVCRKTQ